MYEATPEETGTSHWGLFRLLECVGVEFNKFRHNIVKVAVDPRGDSRVDPQTPGHQERPTSRKYASSFSFES